MNHLQHGIMVALISASVSGATWAATIVERQEMGNKQTVTLDRQHVRIDSSDKNFYILMDLRQGKSYTVDKKERRIVKMNIVGTPPQDRQWERRSQPPRRDMRSQPVKAKLLKIGRGPSIAGYPTVNYEMKANNKVCSKNSFSKQAANVPYIKDFLNAISKMSNSRKIKGMSIPPCFQAHNDLEADYMRIGVPMKIVIKGKKGDIVMYEITRIQTNVRVSSQLFRLPNYQIISEKQMIKESMAKMEKWRKEAEQSRGLHRYNRPPQSQQDRNDYRGGDYNRPPQEDYRGGNYNNPPAYDPSMMPPR